MSNLVEKGGESLKKGNNISYLASGGTGLLGIIDSAECVPTYGAGNITWYLLCFLTIYKIVI